MESTPESPQVFTKRASKKWLFPLLWLCLIAWYFQKLPHRNPHTPPPAEAISQSSALPARPTAASFNGKFSSLPYGTDPNITYTPANITTSLKAAVIIETRAAGNFIPLILHFANVLGPTWPVIIYTPAENYGSFSTSAALNRYIKLGRVVIKPLGEGVWFPNWNSVTEFLVKPWLWEDLEPAENILLFQSDSVLCSNSVRSVDDFLEWDYIGAPIAPAFGRGFNGGLSLRRRSTFLSILEEFEYGPGGGPEDQWYYARMKNREEALLDLGLESPIRLPSMEIARTFAVETIDYPNPLGLHQPMRFIGEGRMRSLDEWCPEYKLAMTERINE